MKPFNGTDNLSSLPTFFPPSLHTHSHTHTTLDPHLSFFGISQWGIIAASLTVTALLEAYTWQIDNLIVGLFQFAFFLSFL